MSLKLEYYYVYMDNLKEIRPIGIVPTEEIAWTLVEKDINKKYEELKWMYKNDNMCRPKVFINNTLKTVYAIFDHNHHAEYYIERAPFYNTL